MGFQNFNGATCKTTKQENNKLNQFKLSLNKAVMVVSMFLTLFQAVLIHVNTLMTTLQA